MSEQKKDMTNLMDFAKSMQESGQIPDPPAGSVMEEQKIDKIDNFESLEDFGKANPAPEPPAFEITPDAPPSESAFSITPPAETESASVLASIPGLEPPPPPLPDGAPIPDAAPGFEASPAPADAPAPMELAPPAEMAPDLASPMELAPPQLAPEPGDTGASLSPEPLAPPPLQTEPSRIDPVPPPLTEGQSADGAPSFSSVSVAPDASSPPPLDEPVMDEPLRPARKVTPPPLYPMDKVKQFSEQLIPSNETVQAAYPFSLVITGTLAPEERERLLDILARENMGIREMDLEPQFAEGKILIPRISEYAGVLIISALRSTRAKMRLGPSDSVYATVDTRDSTESPQSLGELNAYEIDAPPIDPAHTAEKIPVTTESRLPGKVQHAVVDLVTASAALKTMVVQAETSPEYQRLVEALQRELKYKAYAKGATAITSFSVQLMQLHMPMHYRVMVSGSAVKTD